MKKLKENAAAMLLALFCAVFVMPTLLTSCENGIEGIPTFTPSQKFVRDTIFITIPGDTIVLPGDTTVIVIPGDTITLKDTVTVVKHDTIGVVPGGKPWLKYENEQKYITAYPLVQDGIPFEPKVDLEVFAQIGKGSGMIVVNDSIFGNAALKVTRTHKTYTSGDFAKAKIPTTWGWSWTNGANIEVLTGHEMAWWKNYLQMLSYSWMVHSPKIRYSKGVAFVYEGQTGKLFNDTLVWKAQYGPDDMRELRYVQQIFWAPKGDQPDPDATRRFGKDFEFKTTGTNTAETSLSLWETINGKDVSKGKQIATLKFRIVSAVDTTVVVPNFNMEELEAVPGSKVAYGNPVVIGNIEIQDYRTTYTSKTNFFFRLYYGYTQEAQFINPEELGGNIKFLAKDIEFKSSNFSPLKNMDNEGNYVRKQTTNTVTAVYFDRSLEASSNTILKMSQEAPDKILIGYEERSWDGKDSYVIRHFYDDNTYEDITVIDPRGCQGNLTMNNGTKIYRDNTDFGKPTIAKKGEASKKGSAIASGKVTRQQMMQTMKASFDGYAHDFEYEYTNRSYSTGGLDPINLSIPKWVTDHIKNDPGTVRNEVETEKNYEVTPMSFIYSAAYGKNNTESHSHSFEVWKFISEVSKLVATKGKDFGFDYVDARTSKTYFTAYNEMSDNSNVDLGTEAFDLNNYVENSARQIINTDNFDVTEATAVSGSKTYQSERTVNGKWGKAVIKRYRTTYVTKTNKAETTFFMYHEEAVYYPTKGEAFALLSKEYSAVDNGISSLEDLGRKDGKDGKLYKSNVTFSFNDRFAQMFNEVELWVKADNKHGIDTKWTSAYAGAVHFWDPSNTHHISMTGVYNNKDGVGGIKGYSDGREVIKATWDEVNKPTGRLSVAQDAGGTWYICQVSETSDKKGWIWRSIMKSNNGAAIRSVQKTQLQIYGTTEVYINTTAVENADGSVTLNSASGSITLGAW